VSAVRDGGGSRSQPAIATAEEATMSYRSRTAAGLAALALTGAVPALAAGQDLRSPDARDAAAATPTPVDLSSPDARDVTRPRTIVPVRVVTVADDGFGWNDVAIGAGGAFGLTLLLAGGVSLAARRRAGRRVAA
jgi:hypothetical protein